MSETTLEQEFERWWEQERGDLVFEPSTRIYLTDLELFTGEGQAFLAGYKLAEKREIKVNRLVAEIGKELGDLRISFHNSIEIIGRQLEDKKKLQEEIDTLKQTVSILKEELREWMVYDV